MSVVWRGCGTRVGDGDLRERVRAWAGHATYSRAARKLEPDTCVAWYRAVPLAPVRWLLVVRAANKLQDTAVRLTPGVGRLNAVSTSFGRHLEALYARILL